MDLTVYNNVSPPLVVDEYLFLHDLYMKGDDVQKLSVIQALPQLLQYDPNATITRIVPKIQQELPKSSCEFHIATSKIFKLLIEKQLPLNLMSAVLQGIESKDPIVSNAWIETLLAVMPILPLDQVKSNVLTLALNKAQPASPVYGRVGSCKILGKAAVHPKMTSSDVTANILPSVQSLCQDCYPDVRATMCAQLHLVAQGLGENLVKTSLLPSLVELAADDNMPVRCAAVGSVVLVVPFLDKQTRTETIVPLIKQLCQKATETGDTTYTAIAREFGKLLKALETDLNATDSMWFLQFFKMLAIKGHAQPNTKETFDATQAVTCREQCAFNLPAVTSFTVSKIPSQLEFWHTIFSELANDSCYLVRKTSAGCIHEIAKLLGAQCKLIKQDLVKLLRDDAEEVLQMLVPHLGETLQLFSLNGVLSKETTVQSTLEIARALLKCHMELSKGYKWRIKTNLLEQMEKLPECMPSDFIHQHFSPVILNCAIEARPIPVRSQAARTLLIFLRNNLKEIHRKWIRDNLIQSLCFSKSCYTRNIFILCCLHAAEIFSNLYFKKYFIESMITLAEDPISNLRLSVAKQFPLLYRMLVLPDDKKLQGTLDSLFAKLDSGEKDKDVREVLRVKLKEIRMSGMTPKQQEINEEKRKQEEENKINQGKSISVPGGTVVPAKTPTEQSDNRSQHPLIARSTSAPPSRTPSIRSQPPTPASNTDMSFLAQHFYTDAGIKLPPTNTASSVGLNDVSVTQLTFDDVAIVDSLLNTSITDDMKVDLKKRTGNKKKSSEDQMMKRRSLNVGPGGDGSRIPISALARNNRPKSFVLITDNSSIKVGPKSNIKSALPVLKRRTQSEARK